MEDELQTALASLERYRRLQTNITDGQMLSVLDSLVQEMQLRIGKLEKTEAAAPGSKDTVGTSL